MKSFIEPTFPPQIKISNSRDLASYIRYCCLNMTSNGKSSHIASCLSVADILAVLYSNFIKTNHTESLDKFILSKGHAGAALYSCLAGIGLIDPSLLVTHYMNGSKLSGHVSHKVSSFIEFSTGSLGQGLSVAVGIALNNKLKSIPYKVYCVLSDGELNEGSNWEAIMFASHWKLNNLTVIIDNNKYQSLKTCEETLNMYSLSDKFKSFGFETFEVDGHDHNDLFMSLNKPTNLSKVIIANTTKGKGVDFMENNVLWHYKSPDTIDLDNALKQISI